MKTKNNKQVKIIKILTNFFFLFILGIIIYSKDFYKNNNFYKVEKKAQLSTAVEIGAEVKGCILNIKVYPEKRIPSENNWATTHYVKIYESGTKIFLGQYSVSSNNYGESEVDLCSLGYNPSINQYDFYIKGDSHLQKLYTNKPAFQTVGTNIDFTSDGDLLAGETSNIYDNYINSLDISTQIKTMYTNSYKNDLNQDSLVNSLDISNTVYNFYKEGENN